MISREGDVVRVGGEMTLVTAGELLKAGEDAIVAGGVQFDLSAVTNMDSSGLAVVFGWARAANAANRAMSLRHPPENLFSLADVYGVRDLLPAA